MSIISSLQKYLSTTYGVWACMLRDASHFFTGWQKTEDPQKPTGNGTEWLPGATRKLFSTSTTAEV